MRILMAAAIWFLWAGLGMAADPDKAAATNSEVIAREDHLRLALEHLRSLGLNDDADRVARHAQGTSQTPLERLAEARTALDRLLEEIHQLEEETGFPQQIELRIRCMEMATAELELLRLKGKSVEQSLVIDAARSAELTGQLDDLQKAGKAKTLADAHLATNHGRPATMTAGGQFPYVVPAEGGKVAVRFIEFGNRIEVLSQLLESHRVRVDIAFENSERDISRAAEANGQVVPALRRCRLNTQFEAGFGQTVLWLINVPEDESHARSDAAKPDGKALGEALAAAGLAGVNVRERPTPRTAILLVRAERVDMTKADARPSP